MKHRQIILDTETTGLSPEKGHRLIEVGCLEMINRRLTESTFHCYINPERPVDPGAVAVHGLTDEFLSDKPLFSEVAEDLFAYLEGAELIIHNAPFDVGFLNAEYAKYQKKYVPITKHCQVIDTLVMARQMHPGQPNTLDALCRRYGIDNTHRELHGALLDSELLAQVYLRMTGGQSQLFVSDDADDGENTQKITATTLTRNGQSLPVIHPTSEELSAHEAFVKQYLKV